MKRLLAVFSIVCFSGCFCSDEVVAEHVSPDGVHVATVTTRDCGATTNYATHIRVSRRWWRGGGSHLAVVLEEPASLRLEWESSTKLRVVHAPARVFRDEKVVDGVAIERQQER